MGNKHPVQASDRQHAWILRKLRSGESKRLSCKVRSVASSGKYDGCPSEHVEWKESENSPSGMELVVGLPRRRSLPVASVTEQGCCFDVVCTRVTGRICGVRCCD